MSKFKLGILISLLYYCLVVLADPISLTASEKSESRITKDLLNSVDKHFPTPEKIQVYTKETLEDLIKINTHLENIRDLNKCQLTPEIQKLAKRQVRVYEFIYADMLMNGICVNRDTDTGLLFFKIASGHGYAPAIRKLAQFYLDGVPGYIDVNLDKAFSLLRVASMSGSEHAKLAFGEMIARGYQTNDIQKELAYSMIFRTQYNDSDLLDRKNEILNQLESIMTPESILNARRRKAI